MTDENHKTSPSVSVDGYFIVNAKHQTSSTVKTSKMLKMSSFMRKFFVQTPEFFHCNEIVICKLYHELHRGKKILYGPLWSS